MSAEEMLLPQMSGMEPAGMLRIRRDGQERFVWPVHLPGWLALGWRVAGADEAQAAAARSGAMQVEPEASPQEAPTGKGSRNRRRKESSDATAADAADPSTEAVPSLDALPVDLLDDPLT